MVKRRYAVLLAAGIALGVWTTEAQATVPQVAVAQSSGPAATLKSDLQKALLTTESFDALHVKAAKTATGLWVLNVAPDGIGWGSGTTDTSQHSEATVVVGWYDADGKLMGNLAQEQMFKRVIVDGDAVYSMNVTVPKNAMRLRFVVRDALNGHMGTLDLTTF
jgi:hypothetical protein